MPKSAAALAALLLALAPAALAQSAPPAVGTAKSLQGDQSAWINDPHMHAFYDLTRTAFAAGPAKVDVADFKAKAFQIFHDFAVARGIPPEHMLDHLKLIPDQVVQIVTEDPKVLDSYDNFSAALFGPP